MCLSCSPSADAANRPANGPANGPVKLARRGLLAGLGLAGLAGCVSTAPREPAAANAQPARFELVLLGTEAGPPIQPDRAGIASALVVDGHVYLVDCGRAAATQYVRAGLRLSSLAAIFQTHLHADHVATSEYEIMRGDLVRICTVRRAATWTTSSA